MMVTSAVDCWMATDAAGVLSDSIAENVSSFSTMLSSIIGMEMNNSFSDEGKVKV